MQKAGFMLIEVAFANNPCDRRHVIILVHIIYNMGILYHWLYVMTLFLQKYQDAFASAFGFFLFGFDYISGYHTNYSKSFLSVSEPTMWFFKVSTIILLSVAWIAWVGAPWRNYVGGEGNQVLDTHLLHQTEIWCSWQPSITWSCTSSAIYPSWYLPFMLTHPNLFNLLDSLLTRLTLPLPCWLR